MTGQSNQREGAWAMVLSAQLGVDNPYPKRQPYLVEDTFGMLIICQSLLKSLDVGWNAGTIQFETMQSCAPIFKLPSYPARRDRVNHYH